MGRFKISVILGIGLALSTVSVPRLSDSHLAYAQGSDRCILSTPVAIDGYYSAYNVTVGEPVQVTGELRSQYINKVTVEPIPIVDRDRIHSVISEGKRCEWIPASVADDIKAAEWQITNATFLTGPKSQFVLESSEKLPFSFEMKTTKPGTYIVSLGFVFVFQSGNSTEEMISIGYGQPIIVRPTQELLQKCDELGMAPESCSEVEILKQECLGPACDIESRPPIVFDAPLMSLFVALGATAVAGAWFISRKKQ